MNKVRGKGNRKYNYDDDNDNISNIFNQYIYKLTSNFCYICLQVEREFWVCF